MSRTTRIARLLVSKEKDNLLESAMSLVHEHAPDDDLYGIFWHPGKKKIFVNNGDWAEYDTRKLLQALKDLLGAEHADMESEVGRPDNDPGWMKVDLDTHKLKEF